MRAWVLENIKAKPIFKDIEFDNHIDFVTLDIKASALNHRDIWITKGLYPRIVTPVVLGSDACGLHNDSEVIINPGWYWGKNETYQSNDFRVLGMPDHGTFAQKISVPREYIYPKPYHLNIAEAAALPLAGVTAFRALVTKCNPKKGQKVLISGIGGGVALMAFQFALALGCDVYVTSGSQNKIIKAIELGAAGGVNYKDDDWPKQLQEKSGGFDIVIDSAGGSGFNHFIKLMNPGGRIAFYGASLGNIPDLNPQPVFWKQISILGSTMGSDADFLNMLNLVNKYKIKPIIDTIIPFEKLDEGFERMESGQQFGKIVFSHSN